MSICFWRKKSKKIDVPVEDEVTFNFERKNNLEPIELESKEILVVEPVMIVGQKKDEVIPEKINEMNAESKVSIQKYHVSQNKDKDADNYMKWRVRKESSNKTIQYFDTQKIAIDYAQELALKVGSSVVIHKLNGAIRRQDYTKKKIK